MLRYSRLIFRLLFYGCQNRDDLSLLLKEGLLLPHEQEWLKVVNLATRAHTVLMWLQKCIVGKIYGAKKGPLSAIATDQVILSNIANVRGGIQV